MKNIYGGIHLTDISVPSVCVSKTLLGARDSAINSPFSHGGYIVVYGEKDRD